MPITHAPQGRRVIALPAVTEARVGVDDDASWMVCTKVNRFVWQGPDLRPLYGGKGWSHGSLSRGLYERIRRTLLAEWLRQRLQFVPQSS